MTNRADSRWRYAVNEMNHAEAENLVTKTLAGLFPNQLSGEQARFAAREFLPFSVAGASRAIREHRKAHEFISWPKLLEGCRAAEHDANRGVNLAEREQSWCDVQRRLHPQLDGRCDVEVILRVHRQWAALAVGGGEFAEMSAGYRRQIETSCKAKLVEVAFPAGVVQTDEEAAATFVWVAQTAELVFASVETFKQVLSDLRGDLAAA